MNIKQFKQELRILAEKDKPIIFPLNTYSTLVNRVETFVSKNNVSATAHKELLDYSKGLLK